MATASVASAEAQPNGIVTNLRAVVSAAAELVAGAERVVNGSVRTARDNAREALEADRARAQARDEMDLLVRSLLESGPGTVDLGRAPGARTGVTATLMETAGRQSR